MNINLTKANFLLFILVIILYPINYKLFFFLRPSDLFILILIFSFLLFYKFRFDYIVFLLFVFLSIFLSTFFSYKYYNTFDLSNLIFFFKILSIIIVISCVYFFSKNSKEREIQTILFIAFIFQIIWVYIYAILINFNLIDGNIRVSYFLSNLEDRRASDAHLYANMLALSLVYYLMYWRNYFNINKFLSVILIFLTLIAIFLTGSKNPIVILLLYFIISLFYKSKKLISLKTLINSCLFIAIVSFTFYDQFAEFFSILSNFIQESRYGPLVNRIYYSIVSPEGDDSIIGRYKNIKFALSQTEYSYGILGKGLNGSFKFYDGIHSFLIATGGFLLLIISIIFISFHFIKTLLEYKNRHAFNVYLLFLFLFIVSNIITEFIFVNRWMIPVLSILTLQYLNCFKPITKKIP